MTNLGRLERIDLRDIWQTEDQHFTPWLAREENIGVLADTLGLELEVEAQEKSVGPFRADILYKDLRDDTWVLIENQLERTDHRHLGQLLTYAAGLQAVTIVWVAATFTDEHREAVDWLNKITSDAFRFFALEVELWRIGDSAAAPKFNMVSKPNEWSRAVHSATRRIETDSLTETKQLQLAYWVAFNETLQSHPYLKSHKPYPRHWTNFSIGRSGAKLSATVNTREDAVGVELYLMDENASAFFQALAAEREQIERELGFAAHWQPLPGKTGSRIRILRPDSPLSDKSQWPAYHAWMIDQLEAFNRVFRERIKHINPDDFDAVVNPTDDEPPNTDDA